jgi:hypothetical protein
MAPGLLRCFERARKVSDLEACALERVDDDLARVHARLVRALPRAGDRDPSRGELVTAMRRMVALEGARAEQAEQLLRDALTSGGVQ